MDIDMLRHIRHHFNALHDLRFNLAMKFEPSVLPVRLDRMPLHREHLHRLRWVLLRDRRQHEPLHIDLNMRSADDALLRRQQRLQRRQREPGHGALAEEDVLRLREQRVARPRRAVLVVPEGARLRQPARDGDVEGEVPGARRVVLARRALCGVVRQHHRPRRRELVLCADEPRGGVPQLPGDELGLAFEDELQRA